jgi:hypothetical protein
MKELLSVYSPIIYLIITGIAIYLGVLLYDVIRDTPEKGLPKKF